MDTFFYACCGSVPLIDYGRILSATFFVHRLHGLAQILIDQNGHHVGDVIEEIIHSIQNNQYGKPLERIFDIKLTA